MTLQFETHPIVGRVARITAGDDIAWIAPQGGQVVRWTHAGRDMLWCARKRLPGKSLRGGIPLCWPWFGSHPNDGSLPNHGVARLQEFDVADGADDRVTMRLPQENLEAELHVRAGDGLEVSLTTSNSSDEPVAIEAVLHTYLAVRDVEAVAIEGLDGTTFLDQLDDMSAKRQEGNVTFNGEVDRIYSASDPVIVRDGDGEGSIVLDGRGSCGSVVVWNPWIEKSARLGDMAPDDFRRMVCVETGWIGADRRTINAGESQTLSTHFQMA